MSLNPASQPFFPTTTMRRESSTGSAGLGFQLDTESFPPDAFPTLSLLSTSPKSQDNPNDSSAGSDNGFIGSASSSGTDHDYDTPQGTGAITPNNQSVTPTTATVLGGIPHHPNGPPLRSMSLSVVPRYSSSPAPAVTRKSSVNSFTTAYDFQPSATPSFASRPSRSPMPSSFQNYSLTSSSPATNNPPPLPPNQAPGSSSSLLNSYHPPPTTPSAPLNGIPILNSQQSHHQQQPSDAISSISPSSSARSSSAHAFEASLNFDSQAKSSPFINDILDRLIRCEYTTRDIHREIGDLTRKVNFLVERAMSSSGSGTNNIAPDPIGTSGINGLHRKDSFSQSPLVRDPPGSGLGSLSLLQNNGSASSLLLPPPGTPNHLRDVTREKDEEIRQLNQKINSLTTSVAQLLAVQTQAHIHNVNSAFSPNVNVGLGGGAGGLGSALNTPNLSGTPDLPQALGPAGGGPVGSRTNPRAPVPVRTWSAGNMMNDPGLGPTVGVSRQDSMPAPGMLRDKRRSIAGGLGRRDSGGPGLGLDSPGADWGGRDREAAGGPVISKWEHLPLQPELLRSISKYGVGPPNKIQQRALPFLLRGADIIAQAPPTQERIGAYVIPAIHLALSLMKNGLSNNIRGPLVLIISTTVDQATQAQRMIRDLGGVTGVRSALGVGTGGDVVQELRLLNQSMPHILCGTPQKLHSLFTAQGVNGNAGLSGAEVRLLVLDEVDQLIARNLHEYVFGIVKLLPGPRTKPLAALGSGNGTSTPGIGGGGASTPGLGGTPSMGGGQSTFNPFDAPGGPVRRFSSAFGGASPIPGTSDSPISNGSNLPSGAQTPNPNQPNAVERQSALFSNTVPQDVLNLANTIQLREPIRVLVRRDGGSTTHGGDSTSGGSRGLRQFYLYLAFTAGGGGKNGNANADGSSGGLGIIGSGRSAGNLTSAESAQAREWKLDALADLFDDVDATNSGNGGAPSGSGGVTHAIVHVGGVNALETVVYRLASRGFEAVPLHGDMTPATRMAALNKFRAPPGAGGTNGPPSMRTGGGMKVLVIYDVQVKAPDVFQVPLVVNYDLPKAVEEYAHRVAPAISNSYSRSGVVVNFVTATGGDVEMLRSIECFYKIKCPEVPMSLRDVL